ncbi:hypothetical protein [Brachyspira intermedia]|uniref:hypothetical protein n=1 Tax=Brachyspira intermedia TaxID=84377 RepID=UPI003005C011
MRFIKQIKDTLEIEYPDNFEIEIKDPDTIEYQHSESLKGVDWIIYLKNIILFIEIKNFSQVSKYNNKKTKIKNKKRSTNLADRLKFYKNQEDRRTHSIIYEIIEKGRNSFLREYSLNKIGNKKIYYYTIIKFNKDFEDKLDKSFFDVINSDLKIHMPIFDKKKGGYKKPFIKACGIISTDEWEKRAKNIGAEKIKFSFI